VLSAIDGSIVGLRTIPPDRWRAEGRLILAWENHGEASRLFVYDAWQESDLWSESFARGSRAFLNDSTVAVLEPNGRAQVRRLASETIEVEAQLEREDSLRAVYLLSSADQYLLVTNRDGESRGGGPHTPIINGRVYAFSRPSGRMLWQSPAEIENFGLPIHQPASAPCLWFVRQQAPIQNLSRNAIRSRSSRASILCLDRRDGRTVFARDNVATAAGPSFSIVADRENQTVRLLLPTATVSLAFTGDEVPPEPPVQSSQVLRYADVSAP
jgi:hypothetical protein